jgi:hypothetical protein
MKWLHKLPDSVRSASGLEWSIWRKLPAITLLGAGLPLLCLGLLHFFMDAEASAAQARWLQMADFFCWAVVIFNLTMVFTVAIGCVIVMIMKGPGYVADSYRVSHSDAPRAEPETDEEASRYRVKD